MTRNLLTVLFAFVLISSSAQESILGFTAENAKKQQALEASFEAKLKADNLDEWMQYMAAKPHWVGTEYGEEIAKWIQKQFNSWG